MTTSESTAGQLLVLGLGNVLLQDDGFGIVLLRLLEQDYAEDERVECVDGGTQGLALLGRLSGRDALLILDAYQLGEAAGTLRVSLDPLSVQARRGLGAHEGNASELLAAAALTGVLPEKVRLIGVEPAELSTGIGLSAPVQSCLAEAQALACEHVDALLSPRRCEEAQGRA